MNRVAGRCFGIAAISHSNTLVMMRSSIRLMTRTDVVMYFHTGKIPETGQDHPSVFLRKLTLAVISDFYVRAKFKVTWHVLAPFFHKNDCPVVKDRLRSYHERSKTERLIFGKTLKSEWWWTATGSSSLQFSNSFCTNQSTITNSSLLKRLHCPKEKQAKVFIYLVL